MEGHINITLRLRDKDVDIRIPKRIEVRRFIRFAFNLASAIRPFVISYTVPSDTPDIRVIKQSIIASFINPPFFMLLSSSFRTL